MGNNILLKRRKKCFVCGKTITERNKSGLCQYHYALSKRREINSLKRFKLRKKY